MKLDTETFISDLFARCGTELGVSFLTLTAIHPDGDRPTPSRHVPLGHKAGLEYALGKLRQANARGWGAYLGIAPRKGELGRWSRGGKADLACLPALFVDIDQRPDEAMMRLAWFELPASCILHTGRGYHAYWFLETPTLDFVQADAMLKGLAQYFHGDEALSVAQSMRLPETINTKADRHDVVCSAVGYHPERRYRLREFAPFMPKVLTYAPRQMLRQLHGDHRYAPSPLILDALTNAVMQQLEGHWRSNGFVGANCPFPHLKDHPGMHFSYNPASGWGYCFGKHGKISPTELCHQLGVTFESEMVTESA